MADRRCKECNYRERSFPFGFLRRGSVMLDQDWYCSLLCLEEALVTLAARSLAYPMPEVDYQHRVRIGSILVQKGLLRPEQLAVAIEMQALEGGTIGSHILALGYCTEQQLTVALSEQQGIPWAGDVKVRDDKLVRSYLPRKLCEEFSVFPFDFDSTNQVLFLAARSPLKISFVHMLRKMVGCQVQALIIGDAEFSSKFEDFLAKPLDSQESALCCSRDAGLIGKKLVEEIKSCKGTSLRASPFENGLWIRVQRRTVERNVIVLFEKRAKTAGSTRQNLPYEKRISV